MIGEKERNGGQGTESKAVNPNHTNHTDHNGHSAADRLSAANGQPAKDFWEGLDIPPYLRRARLGPPAISAGPDDDLGDLK